MVEMYQYVFIFDLVVMFHFHSGEMFRTTEAFGRGVSTGYAVLDQFVDAVILKFPDAIRLPDAKECECIAQALYNNRGMPGCIGAIDGKHFAIHAGKNDDSSYKNYKGFRSVSVLGMANHLYQFTWISSFWPGTFSSSASSCMCPNRD